MVLKVFNFVHNTYFAEFYGYWIIDTYNIAMRSLNYNSEKIRDVLRL